MVAGVFWIKVMRDNIIRLQSYYAEQHFPLILRTLSSGLIHPKVDLLATSCLYWSIYLGCTRIYCHFYHLAGLSTEKSIIFCRFNGNYLPINNPLSFAMAVVHRHSPFCVYCMLKPTGIDGERCEQKSARIQLAVSLITIVIILRLITWVTYTRSSS